jgi:DNA-binding CsgD family transcriptional regulator
MWFRDIGSSGGSQLNGVPILPDVETCIVVGDRLNLGGLEMFLVSPHANVIKQAISKTPDELQNARTSEHQAMGTADSPSEDLRSVSSLLDGRLYCLSPAELEVLQWFCRGHTVKEVGETLFRSPHTVKTQLNSIYKKLGVHSRAELLMFFKLCENAWTKSQKSGSPTVKVGSRKGNVDSGTMKVDSSVAH